MALYLRDNMPKDEQFEEKGLTPFALAMPDKYKTDDAVLSYRNYYMSEEKQKIASWKKRREKPEWYKQFVKQMIKNNKKIIGDQRLDAKKKEKATKHLFFFFIQIQIHILFYFLALTRYHDGFSLPFFHEAIFCFSSDI